MYGAEKIIIFRKGGIGTGRRGKDGGSGRHEFKQGVAFASGKKLLICRGDLNY